MRLMADQTLGAGSWTKVSRSDCADRYPARLELREGGIYTGTNQQPGTFTQWDAGTYRVLGPGRVEISVANDALITYTFALEGDTLTFTDPDGCTFEYRRTS